MLDWTHVIGHVSLIKNEKTKKIKNEKRKKIKISIIADNTNLFQCREKAKKDEAKAKLAEKRAEKKAALIDIEYI